MPTDIRTLLDELYELEPALREKEEKIIQIIEKMQANRPSIEIDEAFKQELRKKVLSELHTSTPLHLHTSNWGWIFAGFSTTAFAVLAVYTFFGGFAYQEIPAGKSDKPLTTVTSSQILSFAPSVTKLANNAYGNDIAIATSNNGGAVGLGTREAMSSITPASPGIGGGRASIDAKMMATDAMTMPPIDYPYYTYVYTGSLPTLSSDLTVYKRNPSGFTSLETASFLSNFTIDGIDLSALRNKNLTNLSFVEEQDFGYSVSLDFQNGNVNIYQNWNKWPQLKCDESGCEQLPKITEKDIPSDEEFIQIADGFLTKYGINRSLYGTPRVDGSWRIMYARAVDSNQEGYIPDQYNVTYPMLLDGKALYEEYGGYKGLTLTIDIRTKRVTSMYGLEKQNLTSSIYTTLTPEDILRKMIRFGGRYETKPYGEQKTVEITLSEPTIQYIHIYGEWKDGKSDEYYVPAYVFPVQNKPEGFYIQDSIAIPVVADFAKFVPISDTPVAVPMPAVMEKTIQ